MPTAAPAVDATAVGLTAAARTLQLTSLGGQACETQAAKEDTGASLAAPQSPTPHALTST